MNYPILVSKLMLAGDQLLLVATPRFLSLLFLFIDIILFSVCTLLVKTVNIYKQQTKSGTR